jgi:hypothetical protein
MQNIPLEKGQDIARFGNPIEALNSIQLEVINVNLVFHWLPVGLGGDNYLFYVPVRDVGNICCTTRMPAT